MINNLVVPIDTSHFVMDGIVIRESSGWAVVAVRSNDLAFRNLKLFNSLGMGENDGIDICESQDVVVQHTIGISLDDPFSTKAWKEDTDIASGKVPWPGNPEPVRNVLFEDTIAWTLCYGYKIGQGIMQDQSNIVFRNGVVYKAAVGFAIHHKYGTGTVIITVRDAGESFAKIKGVEGAEITDLMFENVYMPGASVPATTLHEMNFLSKEHYGDVTIRPVQNEEPLPRTNLALHRPAVASSNDGLEDTAPYVNDGSLTTRFGSKRGVDPGWIYVDLGETKTIDEVRLFWEAAYGKSYRIQIADDPSDEANWRDVYSTTTGKGGLETITFDEVEARYVRMYGTIRATIYGYSIWEFEVYGPER